MSEYELRGYALWKLTTTDSAGAIWTIAVEDVREVDPTVANNEDWQAMVVIYKHHGETYLRIDPPVSRYSK